MNHRSSSTELVEQSIKGFLYFKSAEGLTDRTLESYLRSLSQCTDFAGTVKITQVVNRDILAYMTYLRN